MADTTTNGNGRRWYDPNRLLMAIGGVFLSVALPSGGWAIGHITASDRANAVQDVKIEALATGQKEIKDDLKAVKDEQLRQGEDVKEILRRLPK